MKWCSNERPILNMNMEFQESGNQVLKRVVYYEATDETR